MNPKDKDKFEIVQRHLNPIEYEEQAIFVVDWGSDLDQRWIFDYGHDAVDFVEQCARAGLNARLFCQTQVIHRNEPWKINDNTNV